MTHCSVCRNSGFGIVEDTEEHRAFHREHLALFPESEAFVYDDEATTE